MFNKDLILKELTLKGWSRYKLCKEAHMAQSTLSDILTGKNSNPRMDTIQKIAQALNVSVDVFFEDIFFNDEPKEKKIEEKKERDYSLSIKEQGDIDDEAKKIIDNLSLSFSKNKDCLNEEDYFAIENALRSTLEAIKIKNKKKFTPKKYK
ncbi:helix-turn-helix domain-containing protein [Clostridium sardiniense]|uniref:Helix-turn-helix domain-containing protein n=1 Tax=Clostridium sardiniense TaxID=29369 RepID=A0ABS7KV10_CLOSR|nr:helix-turn-helix transcriptional regulator [Clostridium sardiniense]MBY0754564.1 helix-turn-helix domain-containing protein [Clostridium sardiniense]MDQ0460835.1 transcriptional regulator with XRE-family HTH domain [Clostridium sardiniense]